MPRRSWEGVWAARLGSRNRTPMRQLAGSDLGAGCLLRSCARRWDGWRCKPRARHARGLGRPVLTGADKGPPGGVLSWGCAAHVVPEHAPQRSRPKNQVLGSWCQTPQCPEADAKPVQTERGDLTGGQPAAVRSGGVTNRERDQDVEMAESCAPQACHLTVWPLLELANGTGVFADVKTPGCTRSLVCSQAVETTAGCS